MADEQQQQQQTETAQPVAESLPQLSKPATPLEAWKALVDEKNPVNWIILGFDSSKNLMVQHVGAGGLNELKEKLDEKEIQFAAIKVVGVDTQQNVTSKRPKYISITFIGKSVSAMKKGLVLSKKSDIDKIFQGVALSLQYSNSTAPPADLTQKTIGKALLAAGGAHKPKHYEFGADEKISIAELYN